MIVNRNEVIIAVDVDGTLIRRVIDEDITNPYWQGQTIDITNPYDNSIYKYFVHTEHVELLRQYKGRGFYIKVWSANGVGHAESTVKALGLDDGTVDCIETKPMKHLDDKKELECIVGARVFINKEGF